SQRFSRWRVALSRARHRRSLYDRQWAGSGRERHADRCAAGQSLTQHSVSRESTLITFRECSLSPTPDQEGIMLRSRFATEIGVIISLASAGWAAGQDYPTRPIRVVTSLAGGGNDFTARLIAQGITGPLAQPVVLDNRPTLMAPEIVLKAPPDGYTLLVASSPFFIGPFFQ